MKAERGVWWRRVLDRSGRPVKAPSAWGRQSGGGWPPVARRSAREGFRTIIQPKGEQL